MASAIFHSRCVSAPGGMARGLAYPLGRIWGSVGRGSINVAGMGQGWGCMGRLRDLGCHAPRRVMGRLPALAKEARPRDPISNCRTHCPPPPPKMPPSTRTITSLDLHRSISAPTRGADMRHPPAEGTGRTAPPPRRHRPAALGQPPWGTGNAPSALSASPKTPPSMRLIAPLELYRSTVYLPPPRGADMRHSPRRRRWLAATAAPPKHRLALLPPRRHWPAVPPPTAMGNRQCTFRPARLHKNAAGGKPLLLGLPPSIRLIAPLEVHRSISAPCPWGRYASTLPPKALAGGTAAPKALAGSAEPTAMGNRQCTFRPVRVPTKTPQAASPCSWACRRQHA